MHDPPAVLARAGTDVDDPVGGADGVLVVLHHDQRVAQATQPHQGLDQPVVVALVQADGGLVQHVEHPDQAGADLGGQPDALRLAAGEGAGGPVQGEVVQADVEQEPQPGVDLLEHPLGDHLLPVGQLDAGQQVGALAHRQVADLGDAAPGEGDGEHLGLEPGTAAGRAGHVAHVALVLLPRPLALGVGVPALDPLHHALEAGVVRALPAVLVAVAHVHLVVGAVQDRLLRPRRQRTPGRVDVEVLRLAERLQQAQEVFQVVPGRPGLDRALAQAALRVGDEQFRIDLLLGAQAGALRAGAVRRVEGEDPGFQVLDRQGVVVGAGQVLGVAALAVRVVLGQVDEVEQDQAAGEPQRRLDRVGQPLLGARLDAEPVDHHLDGVLLLLLELRRVGELVHHAVDPGPRVPLGLELGEQVDVLALAAPDHRGEHHEPGALGHREDPVDDLLRALLGDPFAADRAVRLADPGEQQPQVVVDLGDRADGGARVARGGLLVDRHRRAEALDEVDVRLVHLAEELPGVRRQRLDVAALPLGEDRVEGQARLARPGQPGEHDQGVPGQVEADVTQVVLACATDDQTVGHGPCTPG